MLKERSLKDFFFIKLLLKQRTFRCVFKHSAWNIVRMKTCKNPCLKIIRTTILYIMKQKGDHFHDSIYKDIKITYQT